jgi:3-mercaptopyruvate sulfurtransferase SseA
MKSPQNGQGRPIFPLIMIVAGLLLLAGALVGGLNANQAPSRPSSTVTLPAQALPSLAATDPLASIPRVSLNLAKQAFDNKSAIFVDVRDAGSYATGHIPGAFSIPLAELTNHLNELKKDAWIITYCT